MNVPVIIKADTFHYLSWQATNTPSFQSSGDADSDQINVCILCIVLNSCVRIQIISSDNLRHRRQPHHLKTFPLFTTFPTQKKQEYCFRFIVVFFASNW